MHATLILNMAAARQKGIYTLWKNNTFSMKKKNYPVSISTKEMELLDAVNVLGKPVCTAEELRRACGRQNIRQVLSSLVLKGHLLRLERGKYTLPSILEEDPYLVATSITTPSYISLMTAFYIHGFTEQVPEILYVLNAKRGRRIGNVRLVRVKPSMMFGYGGEGGHLVAEPEKAIVDSLYLAKYVPLDETAKALSSQGLDYLKLARYAAKAGNSVVQRLGFLLKFLGVPAGEDAFGLLGRNIGKGYVLLEPGGGSVLGYDSEWKIRINRREYVIKG